jgi:hypothetical protein
LSEHKFEAVNDGQFGLQENIETVAAVISTAVSVASLVYTKKSADSSSKEPPAPKDSD